MPPARPPAADCCEGTSPTVSSPSSGSQREPESGASTDEPAVARGPHRQPRTATGPAGATHPARRGEHCRRTDAAAGRRQGWHPMKLRVGEAASRFTPDLDASRMASVTLEHYLDELADRLAVGWGGFTGTVEGLDPPRPEGVPDDYVMQPFLIRLAYTGRTVVGQCPICRLIRPPLGHVRSSDQDVPEVSLARRRFSADPRDVFVSFVSCVLIVLVYNCR